MKIGTLLRNNFALLRENFALLTLNVAVLKFMDCVLDIQIRIYLRTHKKIVDHLLQILTTVGGPKKKLNHKITCNYAVHLSCQKEKQIDFDLFLFSIKHFLKLFLVEPKKKGNKIENISSRKSYL